MMVEMSTLRPPVEVMLARAVDSVPTAFALSGGVQYEQKWDGYRLVAFGGPRPYLQSRRGAELTDAFPDVAAAVATLPDVVLDGELVIWGDSGLDFPALLQRTASRDAKAAQLAAPRPANFVVFDLLAVDGDDLRREPLRVVASGSSRYSPMSIRRSWCRRPRRIESRRRSGSPNTPLRTSASRASSPRGWRSPTAAAHGTGSSIATATPSTSSSAPSPAPSPALSGSSSGSTTTTPCTSSVAPPHSPLPNNGSSRRYSHRVQQPSVARGHRRRSRRLLGKQGRRHRARPARPRRRGGSRHRLRARTVATRHHVHPAPP